MRNFQRQCKLCGNNITDENFETIDADEKNIFGVLLLKLTFEGKVHYVMCKVCSTKLSAAFNFKATCLYTDDAIVPYVDLDKLKPVDLKEVYVKEKGCSNGTGMLNNQDICRLCFQPMSSNYISIQEVPLESIQTYVPEINFAMTIDPAICANCLDALCVHSAFIRCCSDIEETNNASEAKIEDVLSTASCIKTEELEIKYETDEDENPLETMYNENENQEGQTNLQCFDLTNMEETKGDYNGHSMHHSSAELHINKYKSKTNNNNHFTQDPPEAQMYKCDECDYKSNFKNNLQMHQLEHKDSSEVKMYKCDVCDYKSMYKSATKRHQLRHKDPLQGQLYTCGECGYGSNYKTRFKQHQLRHKDPSEVQVFKCDKCDYKGFDKFNLKQHQSRHKHTSEVQM